ncbi:acyltransferase [Shewanella sp. OPT22]|nr:acyltransferase [Shewanella sp. OPT22]
MIVFRAGLLDKLFGMCRLIFLKFIYPLKNINCWGIIGGKNTFAISGGFTTGNRFITGRFVEVISEGEILIGNNVFINDYSRIVSKSSITIGNNVVFAKFVTVLDHDHKYSVNNGEMMFKGYVSSDIKIGNNVWLGDKVTVLKGVTIGDNVIVGANAVVSKSIPSNCVFAGNPGRVINTIV